MVEQGNVDQGYGVLIPESFSLMRLHIKHSILGPTLLELHTRPWICTLGRQELAAPFPSHNLLRHMKLWKEIIFFLWKELCDHLEKSTALRYFFFLYSILEGFARQALGNWPDKTARVQTWQVPRNFCSQLSKLIFFPSSKSRLIVAGILRFSVLLCKVFLDFGASQIWP